MVTVRNSKRMDEVLKRSEKNKELTKVLEELEDNNGCFRHQVDVSRNGNGGVSVKVEVWVQELGLVGPRNI